MTENQPTIWTESYSTMMLTLRRYVTHLQTKVPVDGLGRPTALVNPQVVLGTGFTIPLDTFVDDPPKHTLMSISYLEGIPTIEGTPIWEMLEGEPIDFYNVFKCYKRMREAKKQRAVFALSLETGMEVRQLEVLRQAYHWNYRVMAYDAYIESERNLQLEMRRLEIEGKHAKAAESLFSISAKYLVDHPELLTPKLALQMLDVATKLERISCGLAPETRHTTNGMPITIQNNIGESASSNAISQKTTITGNLEDDKNRMTQVLNIMNTIGILQPQPDEDIIDVVDVE